MYAHTNSSMPELSFDMKNRMLAEVRYYMATSPRNVLFFSNWEKLEILSNALGELDNPSSNKIALRDVFSERLSPILAARKRFEVITDYARVVSDTENTRLRIGGMWEGVDGQTSGIFRANMIMNGLYNYLTEFNAG
jgi:hypothetical protein